MRLWKGVGLPSDKISLRVGFGGDEPEELLKELGALGESESRVAVVVNTAYPEIGVPSYVNWQLYDLVQESLEEAGLFLIQEDMLAATADKITPVAGSRELECAKRPCLLVTADGQVCGAARGWQCCGYGGPFYLEEPVIDLVLPTSRTETFCGRLADRCESLAVHLARLPDASAHPIIPRAEGCLGRLFRKLC